MSSVLRLYIDERWPERPSAPWALLGASGRVEREGESEPRHWPPAGRCEVVLAGAQTVWLPVALPPRAPRRELPRLIAYALEERLAEETDSQHFTLVRRQGAEPGVLVVARERLRRIVATLAALGHPPTAAVSELQNLPPDRQGWTLALGPGGGILRRGENPALAIDLLSTGAAEPPPLLALLAAQAGEAARPQRLALAAAPGQALPDPAAWAESLGFPVEPGNPYRWFETPANAANLLQGEFAPRHRRLAWRQKLRPALALGLAAGLAGIAVLAIDTVRLARQESALKARIAALAAASLPGQPLIDPAFQLRREIKRLRNERGLLADDDALALTAAVADTLGAQSRASLERLHYENGTLEIRLAADRQAQAGPLSVQLGARGLEAQGSPADGTLRLRPR